MKKVIALWSVIAIFLTILPAGTVKADSPEDVEKAKSCIDSIVTAVPVAEEYAFTEDLANEIDTLGKLLQGITETGDMERLDVYVADRTTAVYQSVQRFYQDYADVQNAVLTQLAEPIDQAIEDVLAVPLLRSNYNTAKDLYENASRHIRQAVNTDYVNAINQLRELLELADNADRTFSRIEDLSSESSDSEYTFFLEDVSAAKAAYGVYDSKFTELRRYGKYVNCLTKTMKNTLLTHYEKYQKALLVYDVEKAYDDLGVYTRLDEVVKEKMSVLLEAVNAGSESDFSISVFDYYRGEAIHSVLTQFQNVTAFEEMMTMTSVTPANKTELTAALRAFRYYTEDLTEDEKELVPLELITKMNQAVLFNTNCEEVRTAIDAIGVVTSEENYDSFVERYDRAYRAYRLFVNTYSGLSDIPELITNIEVLDSATDVLEMIQSIRQIEETEEALMCSKRLQIESLLNGYDRMPQTQKAAVYNIQSLESIYQDVRLAGDLRTKLEVLRNSQGGYSLLDEDSVKNLRNEYTNLGDRAKRYFGDNYRRQLEAVEKELEAQNLNTALRVTTLIDRIGTVDAKARDRIAIARKAYDALTADQKAYVLNLSILQLAEKKYGELQTSVAKASVSGLSSYRYTGTALKPTVSVWLNGVRLIQDIDYTLAYSSNVNIGTAKITVRGIGFYAGSLTKTFTIRAVSIADVAVSGCKAKYGYTGKAVKPSIKPELNGISLRKGTDFTVTYRNNKKRGVATLTLKGIGNYTGTFSKTFMIVRSSIKNVKVSGIKSAYRKTGKAIRPKVKVKLGKVTLKKKRDYILSYRKNKKKGMATVVIKGVGNYSGSKKVKYKIV